jgi:hypothetical protein
MLVPSLALHEAPLALPHGLPFGGRLFRVAHGGQFGGRRFQAGELALVGGIPQEGDAVVLVAIGPGRPRLGSVQGRRILGDRGEPCLTSRWEVAGRLLGVLRPVGTGWAVELVHQGDVDGTSELVGMVPSAAVERGAPPSVGGRSHYSGRAPEGQLSLFAA